MAISTASHGYQPPAPATAGATAMPGGNRPTTNRGTVTPRLRRAATGPVRLRRVPRPPACTRVPAARRRTAAVSAPTTPSPTCLMAPRPPARAPLALPPALPAHRSRSTAAHHWRGRHEACESHPRSRCRLGEKAEAPPAVAGGDPVNGSDPSGLATVQPVGPNGPVWTMPPELGNPEGDIQESIDDAFDVSVQVGCGGIHGSPSKSRVRASMAGTPFLRVVDR